MRNKDLFKMPNSVFKYNLSGTELLVLSVMYSLRSSAIYKGKKYIKISQKSISAIAGLSGKSVSKIIDKLVRYGFITEIRRYFVDEHKLGTYHYTIPVVKGKYFFVSRRIFKKKLSSAQFRMYLFFCKCADSSTRQFWNSYNDISLQLNLHRSSVIKTISELIKMGVISRFRIIKKDGSYADNYYQVNTIIINKPRIHKKRRCSFHPGIFLKRFVINTQIKSFKSIVCNIINVVKRFREDFLFLRMRGSPKIFHSVSSTHFDTIREKNNNKLYLKYRCNLQLYNP